MKINKSMGSNCGFNNFMRTRYFQGMLMTDREFEDEQRYQNDRRKLLNRMLHGWGVVCGLKVKATDPQSSSIIIEPGMALDCWGNEILVCSEQTIDLSSKPCASHEVTDPVPCIENVPEQDIKNLYVVIRYQERNTKPEPVYASGGNCEEKTCEFSRTQEGYCIEVLPYLPQMPYPPEPVKVCTDPFPCPSMNCCSDPHYIVLATISCEGRFDVLSSWITSEVTTNSSPNDIKASYRIEREIKNVCIMPGEIIDVTDTYTFDYAFDNTGKLIFQVDQLDGLTFDTAPNNNGDIHSYQPYETNYKVKANNSGTGKIKIPFTILLNNEIKLVPSEYITNEIVIGIKDVCQSSIIYDAMIRNMEQRKYVPSFQWLAWILTGKEYGELPLTGAMQDYCFSR